MNVYRPHLINAFIWERDRADSLQIMKVAKRMSPRQASLQSLEEETKSSQVQCIIESHTSHAEAFCVFSAHFCVQNVWRCTKFKQSNLFTLNWGMNTEKRREWRRVTTTKGWIIHLHIKKVYRERGELASGIQMCICRDVMSLLSVFTVVVTCHVCAQLLNVFEQCDMRESWSRIQKTCDGMKNPK